MCLTFFVAFPALLADKANDNNLGKREKELVKVEDESGQVCAVVCVCAVVAEYPTPSIASPKIGEVNWCRQWLSGAIWCL